MAAAAPDRPGPDHRAATPNRVVVSPQLRRWLYIGVAAVLAALVVYGVVTMEQLERWAQLTVAVLTLGTTTLAALNTPRGP